MTLPGSWESLNFVSRSCANACVARTSAGRNATARRAPFTLNFIVGSFFSGDFAPQTLGQVMQCKFTYFSVATERATRFSPKNRTRPLVRVRFFGPHQCETRDGGSRSRA